MRVFLIELGAVTAQDVARLYRSLPLFRKKTAKRLSGTNLTQHVLGFCLVRYALKAIAPNADTEHWSIAEDGKPMLKSGHPYFNLSHTSHAVAVAVSANKAVGIDVEVITPRKAGFAERYFSAEEQLLVEAATDPTAELIRIWSAKEAEGKRCGTGLSHSISQIPTANTKSLPISPDGVPHWLSFSPADSTPDVEYVSIDHLMQTLHRSDRTP